MTNWIRGEACRAALRVGRFLAVVTMLGAAGSISFAQQYSVGVSPFHVAAGDLNGDGFADLVTGNFDSGSVSVLLNNGNGTFASQVAYGVSGGPFQVAIGNFNGDAFGDLAVGEFLTGSVAILLNNGDGTFGPASSIATGSSPFGVAAGDLDGDGDDDVIVANSTSNDVSVLGSNGDGTFTPIGSLILGLGPSGVALFDFTGDTSLDLLVINELDANVSVLAGNGDGTFGMATNYGTGINPESIAIGDLDEDGNADVAIANFASSDISLLLGNGDGTFQSEVRVDTNIPNASVVAADLDQDGHLDLISDGQSFAAPTFRSGWIRLPGNGDGTFDASITFVPATQKGHTAVATDDFDHNGVADVAASRITPNPPASPTGGQVDVRLSNAAPIASAAAAASTECTSPAGADVLLDGSGSSDDDPIASFAWFEDFGLPTQVSLGTGSMLTTTLSLGTHSITLRVTDADGATDTDTISVAVVDTVAPSFSVVATPGNIWPPNKRFVAITVTPTVSDVCSGTSTVLDNVVENDFLSSANDIQGASLGTEDYEFRVRARQNVDGTIRIYTAIYTATDGFGNATTTQTQVVVRKGGL